MPADREESPVHEPGDEDRPRDEAEEVAEGPEEDELERAHRVRARRPGWGHRPGPTREEEGRTYRARLPVLRGRSGGTSSRGERTGVREVEPICHRRWSVGRWRQAARVHRSKASATSVTWSAVTLDVPLSRYRLPRPERPAGPHSVPDRPATARSPVDSVAPAAGAIDVGIVHRDAGCLQVIDGQVAQRRCPGRLTAPAHAGPNRTSMAR